MNVNWKHLGILAITLFVLYYICTCIYNSKIDGLENTKVVKNFVHCDDCQIWNHRDARSKCEQLCNSNYPDKAVSYTGEYNANGKSGDCECQFTGSYKKDFVGCPTAKSLKTNGDCFFWNDTEAKSNCQHVCDKFLPGKQSTWTGNWKNTGVHTSACECQYYN